MSVVPGTAGSTFEAGSPPPAAASTGELVAHVIIGAAFGVLLIKSEVVSWFRIQEMFRFQSVHMYGILGSAVLVAAISLAVLRRFRVPAFGGEPVSLAPRPMSGWGIRYWAGGSVFGMGWALTGACPGPLFALVGGGVSVMIVAVAAAIAGTWAYGWLRPRLPH